MDIFTRREKNILPIIVIVVVFLLMDPKAFSDWEIAWLIFFVMPLGAYIATDPESLGTLFH